MNRENWSLFGKDVRKTLLSISLELWCWKSTAVSSSSGYSNSSSIRDTGSSSGSDSVLAVVVVVIEKRCCSCHRKALVTKV